MEQPAQADSGKGETKVSDTSSPDDHEEVVAASGLASYVLMFGCSMLCLFSTGLILGWAGFLLMLQGEGAYEELCSATETTCKAADIRLNLLYTVVYTIMAGTTLPSGVLVDHFSPRIVVSLAVFCNMLGFALIAIGKDVDGMGWDLMFPAFTLIAISSQIPQLAAFQFTELLPQWQGVIIGILSGMFGVSALVPVLLHEIWKAGGGHGTLQAVAISYGAVLGLLWLFALSLPVARLRVPKTRCHFSLRRGFYLEVPGIAEGDDAVEDAPPTLKSQVCSKDFVAFAIFFVCRTHFSALYLGSVNLHLQSISMEHAESLTVLFGWIAPFGVIAGPATSWYVANRSRGPNWGVVEMGCLAAGINILQMVIAWTEVRDLQPIAFVCYTLGQEVSFAAMFSWLGSRFGFTHFGTLTGILISAAGLSCFSVNPLTEAAVSTSGGFRMLFVGLGVLCLATVGVLLLLLKGAVPVSTSDLPIADEAKLARDARSFDATLVSQGSSKVASPAMELETPASGGEMTTVVSI